MSKGDNNGQSAKTLLRELFAHCQSDTLSEEGLREIIERHEFTPNSNQNIRYYSLLLLACSNERVTEGVLRCLLEYFPAAASATNNDGWSPLHYACYNKNVTLNIIELLIDAAPNSIRSVNCYGWMPLHCLCANEYVDEAAAMEMLKSLIEKHCTRFDVHSFFDAIQASEK